MISLKSLTKPTRKTQRQSKMDINASCIPCGYTMDRVCPLLCTVDLEKFVFLSGSSFFPLPSETEAISMVS